VDSAPEEKVRGRTGGDDARSTNMEAINPAPEVGVGGPRADGSKSAIGEGVVEEGTAGVEAPIIKPLELGPLEGKTRAPSLGNTELIMDLPLVLTVELGRTTMLIRDILDLGPGSVIELDKAAGEPVDIFVNGKLIAKGEVVVIDENFGVRVIDILSPGERVSQEALA